MQGADALTPDPSPDGRGEKQFLVWLSALHPPLSTSSLALDPCPLTLDSSDATQFCASFEKQYSLFIVRKYRRLSAMAGVAMHGSPRSFFASTSSSALSFRTTQMPFSAG